ncbi:hypothetical protein HG440_003680 [Candidatus Saccharibacteria bacterium]|nr:hypothetical protein [Candidatus Saccharibacteria bacterium]
MQKPGMSWGVLCSVSLWKTGASYVTFVPRLLLYQQFAFLASIFYKKVSQKAKNG